MAKVSIVVPVYNVEKYLEKCLDSLINQTLKDIEIVCINDGSVDNSLKILKEYEKKDKRIKIISQKNQGLSVARNVGIKNSTGEYIGFVDSDDWVDLDYFELLYNEAKLTNSDIAVAGIKKSDRNKATIVVQIKKKQKFHKTQDKYKICNIPKYNYAVNKIYKADLFKNQNAFFEEGAIFEDILFTHKILFYSNNLVTVPNIYYWYKIDNSSSITNRKPYEIRFKLRNEHNKALKFVVKNGIKIQKANRYFWDKEIKYSLFGVPLIKYREVENCKQLYIMKNIVIWEKTTNYLKNA